MSREESRKSNGSGGGGIGEVSSQIETKRAVPRSDRKRQGSGLAAQRWADAVLLVLDGAKVDEQGQLPCAPNMLTYVMCLPAFGSASFSGAVCAHKPESGLQTRED